MTRFFLDAEAAGEAGEAGETEEEGEITGLEGDAETFSRSDMIRR